MDGEVTFQQIKDIYRQFNIERDWLKFHNPKDVAIAIGAEAGELLECFLWMSPEQIKEKMNAHPEFRDEVSGELADVFMYAICMSLALDIDISDTILKKLQKNGEKYPVKDAGNYKKGYSDF